MKKLYKKIHLVRDRENPCPAAGQTRVISRSRGTMEVCSAPEGTVEVSLAPHVSPLVCGAIFAID